MIKGSILLAGESKFVLKGAYFYFALPLPPWQRAAGAIAILLYCEGTSSVLGWYSVKTKIIYFFLEIKPNKHSNMIHLFIVLTLYYFKDSFSLSLVLSLFM